MTSNPHDHPGWCAPPLCEQYDAHVSKPEYFVDAAAPMRAFLFQEPASMPALVIVQDQARYVEVPLHQMRGLILGLAKLAGRVRWSVYAENFDTLMRDAYLHGDIPADL